MGKIKLNRVALFVTLSAASLVLISGCKSTPDPANDPSAKGNIKSGPSLSGGSPTQHTTNPDSGRKTTAPTAGIKE